MFMGFSRHEYWSGLPFPSPGHLPDPGIEPGSPALRADSLPSEPSRKPIIVILIMTIIIIITAATAEAIVSPGINKSNYLKELANPRLGDSQGTLFKVLETLHVGLIHFLFFFYRL